jgi:AGZA family xanthine/uracil permease-like MFS transporter
MDKNGVFVATVLAAAVGSIVMGLFANYPFVLAPGMGLNAYFAYTIVGKMGFSWQFALFAVFCEGLIFLALSVSNVREAICNAIPTPLKHAVCAGIGLYIAFIGCQNCCLVNANPATLISLCSFKISDFSNDSLAALLALIGVVVTSIFLSAKIRGALIIGIFVTWGFGIFSQLIGLYKIDLANGYYSLLPVFSLDMWQNMWNGFQEVFLQAFSVSDWTRDSATVSGIDLVFSLQFVVIVFALLFVDMFDTLGVLTGTAAQANMLDENGKLPGIRGALLADSVATGVGAILGTSTTTTYIESAVGVSVGGRTGFTAVTSALLFIIALVFAPVFLAIPSFATAPILIIVGYMMLGAVKNIDFSDVSLGVPAFITIIAMPFSYSISDGVCMGICCWTLVNTFMGKFNRVSWILWVLTILFILRYALI